MPPGGRSLRAAAALAIVFATLSVDAKKPAKTPSELRAEYIARLQEQNPPAPAERTAGSLWTGEAPLGDLSIDDKARYLNDIVVIQVAVQTTAAQSGNVDSERSFSASSGISGLAGDIATRGVNPLINANSASVLKGTGQTASNTTFATSLTGHVIDVLPNGYLVIEAEREIYMNNQHENLVIRGTARPDDISSTNTLPSTSLSNLEIELKGKGIISDSVRSPNPLTRAVLWLFGF